MRCIKCNKEIRADIKFCPYCGQLVKKLPPIPKTDVTHTTKEKNEKPKTDLNTEKLESIECFLIALEDVIQYKRNHIKHEEKVTEKQTDSTTEQLSEYEKRLIENSSHEENIDKWKIYIILGITLFLFVKAGISIELSFELLIMTMIVGTIIEVLLIQFFNAYKKNWGCYKAKEKLEKYKSLKGTCDEQIIIQTIEMQFNNNNESSKGLLYFLLCVLVIMLIFAML